MEVAATGSRSTPGRERESWAGERSSHPCRRLGFRFRRLCHHLELRSLLSLRRRHLARCCRHLRVRKQRVAAAAAAAPAAECAAWP
jgi:hypothetical protein